MDLQAIHKSYARWAPVYDRTFGAVTNPGRRRVADYANSVGGDLLEVGVGTGISLGFYGPSITVTGIDASEAMLKRAKARHLRGTRCNVAALQMMDAREMDFADNSFDHVVALHIMSVVPEPERVLAEMARVCKPGGTVLIVNHFARETGFLAMIEKASAPMANLLGWHSDFERGRVLGCAHLHLVNEEVLPPFATMTKLRLTKLA